MKANSFILSLFIISLFTNVYGQNIWRVNNNSGVDADFSTISAAVNNSSVQSGDILMIEPSAIAYNFTSSQKALTYIGSGYFKDENTGLDINQNSSNVTSINFTPGMSGSIFRGLQITGSTTFTVSAGMTIENVLIENCFLDTAITTPSAAANYNNFTFRKNYFARRTISLRNGNWQNFTFENNIVSVYYTTYYFESLQGNNNVIRNNTFTNAQNDLDLNIRITNAYVANNIFDFNSNNAHSFMNSIVKNNLFNNTQNSLPNSATGNIFNVSRNSLYVNTGSKDAKYILAQNSPARGAGVTIGEVVNPDCGAFGATDPYKVSGISKMPTIYEFDAPVIVSEGQNSMNVTFSTKSNN